MLGVPKKMKIIATSDELKDLRNLFIQGFTSLDDKDREQFNKELQKENNELKEKNKNLTDTIMNGVNEIELLKNVVYTYVGSKHEAPIVQLKWGSLLFYGRVESLTFNYTLFKPSGLPLRAKVTLTLIEYQSSEEISKEAAQESPDLTHLIEVKAGDTLPLLCYQIYQDCTYYIDVAKINNLTNFRDLKPGIKLQFPPLN